MGKMEADVAEIAGRVVEVATEEEGAKALVVEVAAVVATVWKSCCSPLYSFVLLFT
jgi:hypothetical protein